MYVCVCVYTYIYIYIKTYTHIYMCKYIYIYIYMCVCVSIYIYIYIHTHPYICMCEYIYTYTHIYICVCVCGYIYIPPGDISTQNGSSLKQVDKFTYQGSNVSSTETDINTRLAKVWTAINRLLVIWKSDLNDKMKRIFFQAAVMLILLYGCTTWTLTKCMEKKLDANYTRKLWAILNKSWRQYPTKQ